MARFKQSGWYKLRYPLFAALLFGGFLLITLIFSTIGNTVQAQQSNPATQNDLISSDADSPNVVASASAEAISRFDDSMQSLQFSTSNSLNNLGLAATQSRTLILNGIYAGSLASARLVGHGIGFIVNANVKATSFLLHLPVQAIEGVANAQVVRNILRPSDHAEVTIIDPNSRELKAALAALPAAQNTANTPTNSAANQGQQGPAWPIHGAITTEFGVVHWPYQPTHTGIDISDGQRPGITPVHPYRPGRVIEVIHSNVSLGNHVVIDHGNGVTSVYGHLYSTNVQVGQIVDMSTVVGLEGSTGASTGTHVHLEIRVNGQAANPHLFIPGNP